MPTFTDDHFQFSIDIPDHWHFMAAAWSPIEQAKRNAGPDDWVQLANKPFCCATADHHIEGQERPRLQVTARPSRIPGDAEAKALSAFQVELLRDEPENFWSNGPRMKPWSAVTAPTSCRPPTSRARRPRTS